MEFIETALSGCHLIRMTPAGDERGYFVRTFCAREFAQYGLNPNIAQASYSYNKKRGTLRGLHFQSAPQMEDKLVRCVRGAIFDVMVDIRPGSPTFGKWVGYELTESNGLQIHSIRGFAHGFQTLTDDCVVAYNISEFYDADTATGIRWNDPDIRVAWPLSPSDQSLRDLTLPNLIDISKDNLMPLDAGN
jgi:dTDP-4-dehydrorhamnose 3,5-epimerase